LVEHLICNQGVAGSSPAVGTKTPQSRPALLPADSCSLSIIPTGISRQRNPNLIEGYGSLVNNTRQPLALVEGRMTRLTGLGFSTALLMCVSFSPAFSASRTTLVGGTGGGRFELKCKNREVLVGVQMQLGSAMDAIGPVCKPLNKKGKTMRRGGPANIAAGRTGGPGGSEQQIVCIKSRMIYSMNVFVDKFNIVNHVEIKCRNLGFRPKDEVLTSPHGGVSERSYEVYCQVNHIPNGIYGNSGAMIDSVGLICDHPSNLFTVF
jgi:hypothetical protein